MGRKKKEPSTNYTMVYEINGYRYKFERIYIDREVGVPYGYCRKTKSWAWLYRNGISHYGPDIDMIPAKVISEMKGE